MHVYPVEAPKQVFKHPHGYGPQSQVSAPQTKPSPHTVVQVPVAPQTQPAFALQFAPHPVPPEQYVGGTNIPVPQTAVHVDAVVDVQAVHE